MRYKTQPGGYDFYVTPTFPCWLGFGGINKNIALHQMGEY
jgi:hypothetical protein